MKLGDLGFDYSFKYVYGFNYFNNNPLNSDHVFARWDQYGVHSDSHNAYNTNNIYTVPITGTYQIMTNSNAMTINNSPKWTNTAYQALYQGSQMMQLSAGSTIGFNPGSNVTISRLTASTPISWIDVG